MRRAPRHESGLNQPTFLVALFLILFSTVADGTPRAVFGRQYRKVSVTSTPRVTTPAQAFDVAHHAAAGFPGFAAPDVERWPAGWRETAAMLPRLRFVADQQSSLRLVWEVLTINEQGRGHTLLLDAVTAAILDARPQIDDAVCSVSNPGSQTAAVGYGQLGTSRWLRASPVARRPGWTHEAFEPEIDGYRPATTIFMGTAPSESGYVCPGVVYGVMPLITLGGSPRYDDDAPPTAPRAIAGRTAADALHHTLAVMSTLKDQFGLPGFAGTSSKAADVVVEQQVYDGDVDTAHYVRDWTVECRVNGLAPCSSVTVSPRAGAPRTAAASLDVMGHEWGHGVVEFAVSNFEGSPVGNQLHEAFANVLGHAVEWLNQGSGNWYEQADWCFGEDHLTSYWPWGAPARVPGVGRIGSYPR